MSYHHSPPLFSPLPAIMLLSPPGVAVVAFVPGMSGGYSPISALLAPPAPLLPPPPPFPFSMPDPVYPWYDCVALSAMANTYVAVLTSLLYPYRSHPLMIPILCSRGMPQCVLHSSPCVSTVGSYLPSPSPRRTPIISAVFSIPGLIPCAPLSPLVFLLRPYYHLYHSTHSTRHSHVRALRLSPFPIHLGSV